MSLFQLGDFKLAGGGQSKWKIECDTLTDEDWMTLALLVCRTVGRFGSVEGVPQGGLQLASRLDRYTSIDGPHLIVDDVLTTAGSMEMTRDMYWAKSGSSLPVIGAVVFARGQCPTWVTPLFTMPEALWLKPRHR